MIKKIMLWALVILVGLAVVFVLGPREPADETITFNASSMGSDLDAYLAAEEAKVPNIKPGAQKQIIWRDPISKAKTEFSVVYVHGFSASLEEVRPLPDIVAEAFDANIFYTRLAGHGRDGDAMAEASANDWYNDTAEALAIGRAIGDKVIVISTSTGGTLVSWAATKPELMNNISALVMMSPNYGVQAAGSEALSMPWARYILPLVFGKERSWEPKNEEQGKWWSTKYPNVALLPMQASVNTAAELPFEKMSVPALFMFHPEDGVVKSDITREIAKRWGSESGKTATIHEVTDSKDTFNHVIAGRILSPANTQPLAEKAIEWIRSLN